MFIDKLLYTAITTPFLDNDTIDNKTLIKHIQYLLDNNSGVVLFGTTGECPTISDSEKESILENLTNLLNEKEKTQFIIGVGGNNTKECILACETSVKYGFTNIMITSPYYNKPTQEGLYQHFKIISEYHKSICSESNIVLYNVPGRSVINIAPTTVKRIVDSCPNVVAIKEASGSLSQVIGIRTLVPSIRVLSGDDGLMVPIMSVGGVGLISVVSNVFPKEVNEILEYCKNNKYSEAFEKYAKINKFTELMFCESNPVPVKYALFNYGLYDSPKVRLPLVELSEENKQKVSQELNKVKIVINKLDSNHLDFVV
jgi:4-hydroxy-tetrahydrodipicolinate synthase